MILSKRMQMVVDLLPKHCKVADVGCDHGFVSIYLCENEISTGVIAMDVNEGPLKRAREHILEHHLQDKIEIRQNMSPNCSGMWEDAWYMEEGYLDTSKGEYMIYKNAYHYNIFVIYYINSFYKYFFIN